MSASSKSAAGASASSIAWRVQRSQESYTPRLELWGGWGKRSLDRGTGKARARQPTEYTATESASEGKKKREQ